MDLFEWPFFDGHMHFSQAYIDEILASYKQCGVLGGINIWSDCPGLTYKNYGEFLRVCKKKGLSKQFVPIYWPDWTAFGWQPRQFVKRLCQEMPRYAKLGCRGLKVWKDLGMAIYHNDGTPARMDDERLAPIWKTVAELGWVIEVHQADPKTYWETHTRTNIPREELWRRRDVVIAANPQIQWILCHTCNDVESFDLFSQTLDRLPNVRSDFRSMDYWAKPQEIKAFMEKYADRLYIGVDMSMPKDRPPDAAWNTDKVYGPWRSRLMSYDLSKETFEKVTWLNGYNHFLKDVQ